MREVARDVERVSEKEEEWDWIEERGKGRRLESWRGRVKKWGEEKSEWRSWEQEKVKKKNGTKCSRGFLFFFFFLLCFFLIVLKNNKLALRKLKTTIFFIK